MIDDTALAYVDYLRREVEGGAMWRKLVENWLVVLPARRHYLHMNTLTVKIPAPLEAEIVQASAQEHLTKSELVRQALEAYLRQRNSATPFVSALDQAGDLVGCFSGGPADLSSNPDHLASFGRV